MKNKKTIQVAFALTLLLLSIISIFNYSEVFDNIVRAVVIPSFFLSLISFINGIIAQCRTNAAAIAKVYAENGELHAKRGEELRSLTEHTEESMYELTMEVNASVERLKSALSYSQMDKSCEKVISVLTFCNIAAYTLLFLSMVLSPYIVSLLSDINLNCLTLWSLTILYFDTELKQDLCAKCFSLIARHYLKQEEAAEQ